MKKYQNFSSKTFHSFGGKIFNIFEKACFRNAESIANVEYTSIDA